MNRRKLIAGAAALAACTPTANGQAPAPFPMRRGVNLGNALEAPREGEWGFRIEARHLDLIAQRGFDGVRVPVRWDQHMDSAGRVDAAHMGRVAEVVGWALDRGLHVQLDVHHYAALIENPRRERARFLLLWRQIGERFAAAPARLMFEPLNEPHGDQWDGRLLSDLQAETVALIRESNPERLIVLGPGNWQNIDALARWRAPDAANIAVSVHYYEPYAFTHQDAEWLSEPPRFGRDWGTAGDVRAVQAHIARAADWGRANTLPMQLGEFGVNQRVPPEQRAAWTRAVREACDAHAMGWCVWDLAGAFAIISRHEHALLHGLAQALLD